MTLTVPLPFSFCSCSKQRIKLSSLIFGAQLFLGCLIPGLLFVREAFPDDDNVGQLFNMFIRASVKDSSIAMVKWNHTTTAKFTIKSFFF